MKLKLLRDGALEEHDWLPLTDADDALGEPGEAISLNRLRNEEPQWTGREARWAVRIQPADQLHDLPTSLLGQPVIYIEFPVFTDGRGYSHARTLRQRYGYRGLLVAIGDVRRDLLDNMRRAGFDACELCGTDSVEDLMTSMTALDGDHPYYKGAARRAS